MTIITIPNNLTFSSVDSLKLSRASNVMRSKYTGRRNAIVYPYAVWTFEVTPREVDPTSVDGGAFRSFLTQLNGVANSFRLPVPAYTRPGTGYAGDCTTSGAVARGITLPLQGLTASTPILRDGDYITVNDELKIVNGNFASDANGKVTISISPGMRAAVGTGTTVKLQKPTVLLCAQDDDIAEWNLKPGFRQNMKLKFWEALDTV